jgi:hypothetical protein
LPEQEILGNTEATEDAFGFLSAVGSYAISQVAVEQLSHAEEVDEDPAHEDCNTVTVSLSTIILGMKMFEDRLTHDEDKHCEEKLSLAP